MPFVLGSSEVGSFPEIQISLPKQDVSSIFMPGSGTENLCKALSSSSPPMRKPVFRHDAVNNSLCRLLLLVLGA
jgi:hypothetical protein